MPALNTTRSLGARPGSPSLFGELMRGEVPIFSTYSTTSGGVRRPPRAPRARGPRLKEGALKTYVDLGEFAERRESVSRRGRPFELKAKGYEARGLMASVSKEVLIAEQRREEFRTLLNASRDAYLSVGIFDASRKSAVDLHAELEAVGDLKRPRHSAVRAA